MCISMYSTKYGDILKYYYYALINLRQKLSSAIFVVTQWNAVGLTISCQKELQVFPGLPLIACIYLDGVISNAHEGLLCSCSTKLQMYDKVDKLLIFHWSSIFIRKPEMFPHVALPLYLQGFTLFCYLMPFRNLNANA